MRKIITIVAFISMLALSGCTDRTASSSTEKNYIANKNSGKLHSISCDSLPYEKNRIYFETIEVAHAAGYTNHHKECMENTADFSSTEKNYIANKNNGKLHSISCDSLPYEKNRIYFETIEAAHAAGYTNHHKECMGS
ncbi:MAG: hypothetical protein K2I93_00070 [Oscillospiraceae bacterium]|nr:hypothetical protein [Oscillospiraceae bacterium]